MLFASYPSPSQHLGGYEWASLGGDCSYFHYSRSEMQRCFKRLALQGLCVGGDSVIGGLYGMLSLMIGGLTNVSSLSPRRHDSILGKSFSSGVSTPPLNMELRELTCSLRKGVQSMLSVRQDRPSVFLMNLRIQHLVIDHSLDNTEKMVHKFFEKINHHRTIDENDRSIGKRNSRFHPKSHFVLLNSMSMLGFRQPYCTNARAEIFSAMVPRVADQAGWLVLDGYNMSLLRPDLALDGMQVSPLGHGMLCLDQTLSIEDVSRP